MHRPTRPPLLALALACAPGEQTSATTKATHASDATDSDSTTSTSALSTSSTTTDATPTTDAPTSIDFTGPCGLQSCPDMAPATCDLFLHNCPEGQKCTPAATDGSAWDAWICVPLDPDPAPPGAPCTAEGLTGVDSCDKGSMCWNVHQDTGIGTCVSLCIGGWDALTCPDPATVCITSEFLEVCLPRCDPLDPSTCPGELCLPNPNGEAGFACILDASGGVGVVNALCAFANACNPGLICTDPLASNACDPNAPGCCQPYCDLTKPPEDSCDAKGGQLCLPFDPPIPKAENVGVCGIPQ